MVTGKAVRMEDGVCVRVSFDSKHDHISSETHLCENQLCEHLLEEADEVQTWEIRLTDRTKP